MYIIYCDKLNASIAMSNSLELVDAYIAQFKLENDVVVGEKKSVITAGVDMYDLLSLDNLTPDIVLTNLERLYYNDALRTLYDDMKTTISNLIVYSGIGKLTESEKMSITGVADSLYEKTPSYTEFLNSLNPQLIIGRIILSPIIMHHVLWESLMLQNRYNQLTEQDDE